MRKVVDINENLSKAEPLTFFVPGDLVLLKHKELKSPVMLVQEKVTRQFKQGAEVNNMFKGLRCVWFDKNNVLQEAVFSTKDLKFYNK